MLWNLEWIGQLLIYTNLCFQFFILIFFFGCTILEYQKKPDYRVRTWSRASLVAQMVKRLPTMRETRVQSPWEDLLEKEMTTHSSILAWKIPWMEEPGRLQPMGSQRVGQDWATSHSHFPFIHWRRKWQPTPVFWPGESHGWRNLVGYSPWGCKDSDTTEWLHVLFLSVLQSPQMHVRIVPTLWEYFDP